MAAYSAVICVVVTCFFTSCIGEGFNFDCRRFQASCGDESINTCSITNGSCVCKDINANYMCQTNETGVCSEMNRYGGYLCPLERVQVICVSDKMFINVNPHGGVDAFGGIIFAYDDSATETECRFNPTVSASVPDYVDDKSSLEGLSIQLNHTTANCGNATLESGKNGQNVYKRKFFIQYNPNYRSSVDQLITAECKLTTGNDTIYGTSNVTTISGSTNYENVTVDDDVKTVTFVVKLKDDTEVPNPVTLGRELKLVFTMLSGSGFGSFKLTECTANNTLAIGNGHKSIDFLKDNCPTKDASALFYDRTAKTTEGDSGVQLTVFIKAFMFQGNSTKVAFQCNIFLCLETNDPRCDVSSCPGFSFGPNSNTNSGGSDNIDTSTTTTPATTTAAPGVPDGGVSRRKRAAEDQARVSSVISVRDPLSQTQDEITESEEKEADCMEETNILAVVIILALSVALLLLTSIILACLLMRSKKKVLPSNRSAVQPVQAMHIPRLELNTSQIEGC